MNPSNDLVIGHPSTMGDDEPLNTTTLIRHAARTNGDVPIVYRTPDGGWDRYTYAEAFSRVQRGANALEALGVAAGDRVGVIDWNSRRHFELYWAIPGIGACMVQMNLRLDPRDLVFVAADSGTSVVLVDETLLPLAEGIAPHLPQVRTWIVMSDRPMSEISTSLPNAVHWEDALATHPDTYDFPRIDERSAYGACYTTGTTGRPKGVFYSHRSLVLHSYAIVAALGITMTDCIMPITPMFHAQAWGMPQAAALTAAKLVLPGRYSADETGPLTDAMIAENVTVTNGAPAIFAPMLEHIRTLDSAPDLSRLRMLSGSSEPPLALMQGFAEVTGAEIIHAYGATETTPLVTVNRTKPTLFARLDEQELLELKRKQGLPVSGVDIRVVGPTGDELPHDGVSAGEVQVRGPWITKGYHGLSAEEIADRFEDGWWRSGDVGTIDADGYLKLTDRLKDVIKSGGEWISSIDMENLLMSHPRIAEASVVGLEHPRWQERPFALVVTRDGEPITLAEIQEHLSGEFAKWQVPEAFEVVAAIPRTSVGKFDKKAIRAQYSDRYVRAADATDSPA